MQCHNAMASAALVVSECSGGDLKSDAGVIISETLFKRNSNSRAFRMLRGQLVSAAMRLYILTLSASRGDPTFVGGEGGGGIWKLGGT